MAAGSGTIAGADLEALVRRVSRLEDERAILDTLHRYGQAADAGHDRLWSELFTEDGEFLCLDRAGTVILREQGRDALASWLRRFRAGETRLSKHCVLAPVIRVDGKDARVDSYLARLIESEDRHDPPFVLLMGRYRDDMAKDAAGRWRFRRRVAETEAPLLDRVLPGR